MEELLHLLWLNARLSMTWNDLSTNRWVIKKLNFDSWELFYSKKHHLLRLGLDLKHSILSYKINFVLLFEDVFKLKQFWKWREIQMMNELLYPEPKLVKNILMIHHKRYETNQATLHSMKVTISTSLRRIWALDWHRKMNALLRSKWNKRRQGRAAAAMIITIFKSFGRISKRRIYVAQCETRERPRRMHMFHAWNHATHKAPRMR